MSLRKIFNVAVDYAGLPPQEWHRANAAVEKDIRALAAQTGAAVDFHKAVDAAELGGAPLLLVGMPQDLAAQVEKIKGVARVDENTIYKTMPRGF
ncbi:MAG: hypothetical protein ACK4PK_05565 [Alphaproteobacteria bacterium]|jgi:hypothetical protein